MFDDSRVNWREQERWHPVLVAQEGPAGKWRMMGAGGDLAGTIEVRRRNGDVVYRVEHRGELVGWANSLKLASYKLYLAIIEEGRPGGAPKADWGERSPRRGPV
jgi:hypothetical protein